MRVSKEFLKIIYALIHGYSSSFISFPFIFVHHLCRQTCKSFCCQPASDLVRDLSLRSLAARSPPLATPPEFLIVFSQLRGSPAPRVSRKFMEKRFSIFFSELSKRFLQLLKIKYSFYFQIRFLENFLSFKCQSFRSVYLGSAKKILEN
jgi:hypothetical protein